MGQRIGYACCLMLSACAADPNAVPGKTLINGLRAEKRAEVLDEIVDNAPSSGHCRPLVLDTHVDAPPDFVQINPVERTRDITWSERWVVVDCGVQKTFNVHFWASSSGHVHSAIY